jgi:hypothetical protein
MDRSDAGRGFVERGAMSTGIDSGDGGAGGRSVAMMRSQPDEESAGGRDVVDLLHVRNERLRDVFTEVVTAEGAGKAALFDELITLLAVHEAVERELIHPLVERSTGPLSAVVTRMMEETNVVDALARLSSMDVEDEAFDIELLGVARVVAMHVQAEERDELPRLRAALPVEELRALAKTLLAAESTAISRASAIQPDARSPEDLGPLAVFQALQEAMRRASRP